MSKHFCSSGLVILFAFLLCKEVTSILQSGSPVPSQLQNIQYKHRVYLDANQTVLFEWRVGDSTEFLPNTTSGGSDNVLVAKLSIPTLGYVATGRSPNGGMPGANMLVMWVDDDTGRAHVEGRYAIDFVEPLLIPKQLNIEPGSLPDTVLAFDGYQNSTHTIVYFVRWLSAVCQGNVRDMSLTSAASHLIYAFGDRDPVDGHIQYHGPKQRGSQTLYLLDDLRGELERDKAAAMRDGKPVDFQANNFKVPPVDTLYQCRYYQLPEITQDVQIVGFEPIVQLNNTDIIHHFGVHLCAYDAFSSDSPPTVSEFACYETPPEQLDANYTKCVGNQLWTWGVGGTGTYFPHNVGYQLTPRDSKRYIVMEIHYNNPSLAADRVDSSGFRMLLSNHVVRPQEASHITLGAVLESSFVIPGNTPTFTIPAFCPEQCTQKHIPSSGTKAFLVFLHSHLLGQSMALRQFRDGVELPPIMADTTYDFNYQQYRPANTTILPGDRLVLECNYSSSERTRRANTTVGGLGTKEEMCNAMLFVTPPVTFQICASFVHSEAVLRLLNITAVVPSRGKRASWAEDRNFKHEFANQAKTINWTADRLPMVKNLQEFFLSANQTWVCNEDEEKRTIGNDAVFPGGGRWQAFKPPQAHCVIEH